MAAYSDQDELVRQIELVDPEHVCLVEERAAGELRDRLGTKVTVVSGKPGLVELARIGSAPIILNAIVGGAGLAATVAALEEGKHLALANKESLVAAGELVKQKLTSHGGVIVPVDSEHSAIWQCIMGEEREDI